MAGFYRNGILVSADVLAKLGIRTLTGAGQEEVWPGTATTRPTPGGIQLRLVSTSVDDDQNRAQKGTITVTGTMDVAAKKRATITVSGTMQPITTDQWECQLAGSVDTGDTLRLTLNGTHYDTAVSMGATKASLVAEVATSAGSGTWDTKKFTYGGTVDVGDTARLTIGAVNYDVVSVAGTAAEIVNLLVAAAAADPLYTVTGFSTTLLCKKKARGVGSTLTSSWIVDTGSDATVTTTTVVTGRAGQSAWMCTDDGVDKVICTHAAAGATNDTVDSGVTVDTGAATTFAPTHVTTGAAADVAAVTLNGTTYSHTIVGGDTTDAVATALAALLAPLAAVTASAVGSVVTVEAATAGLAGAFTLVDASVNNQGGGAALACTVAQTVAAADADILRVTDGTTTFTRTVQTGTLATEAAALAAAIDASAAYVASAVNGVITVTAAVPGTGFTFTSTSVDNQTHDLTVTIDNEALVANGVGPGVRQVALDYLDGSGLKQRELVDLDGTTPVLTVATDVSGILAVTATAVGSAGGAVGTISVTNTGNTVTYDQLAVGASEAPAAVYVVPAKKTFWLHQLQASASAATTIRCKSSYNPATGQVVPNGDFVLAQFTAGPAPAVYQPAADVGPIPAGARIWLTAQGAGNQVLQGTLEGYQAPA